MFFKTFNLIAIFIIGFVVFYDFSLNSFSLDSMKKSEEVYDLKFKNHFPENQRLVPKGNDLLPSDTDKITFVYSIIAPDENFSISLNFKTECEVFHRMVIYDVKLSKEEMLFFIEFSLKKPENQEEIDFLRNQKTFDFEVLIDSVK